MDEAIRQMEVKETQQAKMLCTTLLRNFFDPFYKTLLLFPTTLIIYLHACSYLLYIFFFN